MPKTDIAVNLFLGYHWFVVDLINSIDSYIANFFVHIKSPILDTFFKYLTFLGGFTVAVVVFVLVAFLLYRWQEKALLYAFLLTFFLAELSSFILKYLVNRERPVSVIGDDFSPSFPSGHTLTATILYGMVLLLPFLLNTDLRASFKRLKIFIVAILSLVIILVGVSRLHLGLHHFTDVLGGFVIGLLWIVVFYFLHKKFSANFS